MDFIKHNPGHLSHHLWTPVQHTPQNLKEHSTTTKTFAFSLSVPDINDQFSNQSTLIHIVILQELWALPHIWWRWIIDNRSSWGDQDKSYLSGHNQAGGCGVDGDISSHQSHILELLIHLSVFLVTQGFDGAGENHPLLLPQGQGNGISSWTGKKWATNGKAHTHTVLLNMCILKKAQDS